MTQKNIRHGDIANYGVETDSIDDLENTHVCVRNNKPHDDGCCLCNCANCKDNNRRVIVSEK